MTQLRGLALLERPPFSLSRLHDKIPGLRKALKTGGSLQGLTLREVFQVLEVRQQTRCHSQLLSLPAVVPGAWPVAALLGCGKVGGLLCSGRWTVNWLGMCTLI